MTLAARINLQKGIPENTAHEWTNYHNNNSALDNYILAMVDHRRMILDKKNYDNMVKAAAEDIAAAAHKELENLFKK